MKYLLIIFIVLASFSVPAAAVGGGCGGGGCGGAGGGAGGGHVSRIPTDTELKIWVGGIGALWAMVPLCPGAIIPATIGTVGVAATGAVWGIWTLLGKIGG